MFIDIRLTLLEERYYENNCLSFLTFSLFDFYSKHLCDFTSFFVLVGGAYLLFGLLHLSAILKGKSISCVETCNSGFFTGCFSILL